MKSPTDPKRSGIAGLRNGGVRVYVVGIVMYGYVVGDAFWSKQRTEGEYLIRNTIVIRAKQAGNGWEVRYNMADDAWAENFPDAEAIEGSVRSGTVVDRCRAEGRWS